MEQTLTLAFQFWRKFSQFFRFLLIPQCRIFSSMLNHFSSFGNNFSLRKTFSSVRFFSLVDFLKSKHGFGIFEMKV